MTYTIELTEEQLNVVGQALAEMPYRVSAPVIGAINAQISEQDVKHSGGKDAD